MSLDEPPIQIVDEQDNPIGAMPIDEARAKGQFHRVSRIMLSNPKGQILLQKRSSKIDYPNCWDDSAAGHVDGSEDYYIAAQRELFEEIGVKDVQLEEAGYFYQEVKNDGQTWKRFNKLYKGEIDFTPTDFNQDEVTELRWFDMVEAKRLIASNPDNFTPGLVEVVKRFY